MLFRDSKRSSKTALLRIPEAIYQDPDILKTDQNGQPSETYERRCETHSVFPFTEVDDAEFASIIDANEPWYEGIIQQTPTPMCVTPALSKAVGRPVLHNIYLPLTDTHSTLSTTFQHRAMLSLGRDDFSRTLESIQMIATLAKREAQLPFYVNETSSLRYKETAARIIMTTLLSVKKLNETQVEEVASSLPQRKSDRDIVLLHYGRLTLLDLIQEFREVGYEDLFYEYPTGIKVSSPIAIKDGPIAALQDSGLRGLNDWLEVNRIRRDVDCNRLMQAINQQHDELRKNIGHLSLKQWQIMLQTEQDRLDTQLSTYNQDLTEYNAEELTQIATNIALSFNTFFPELAAADTNLHHCVSVVSRIRKFHQQFGTYPNSLEDLYSTKSENELPPTDFIDAFTNKPLVYRRTETGFVLSSVGKNLVDDSAKINTIEDLPELIDDFVFVWTTE